MKDFKLSNSDISLENGDISLIDGIDQVAQSVEIGLLMIEGENWIDFTVGLPWFDVIMKKYNSEIYRELLIRESILKRTNVSRINAMTLQQTGNTLEIEADILTLYGPATIDLVI